MTAFRLLALACFALAGHAQTNPLLASAGVTGLLTRSVQLMESVSVAIPELARAGAPVVENCRQTLATMQQTNGAQNGALTYVFLANQRAFLELVDAVPKPYPFPAEAQRQLAELREAGVRLDAHFRALLERKETQLRGADRDNLKRYAEANAGLGPPIPGKPRVVFLGDSITDFWHLNEYFPERDFVNRGISGQITGEMLGRLKADVIDLKPEAMVVLAGTNDIARGVPVSTIRNNLTLIADLAEFHKIKPVFASILPVSDYHQGVNALHQRTLQRPPRVIRELNQWLEAFARQRGFLYLNYFDAMVDASGFLKAELADDGLHPNAAGYRVMAPLVLAALEKALPPPASKKGRRR